MVTSDDLKMASEAIRDGKVVLYPTDTVWGIGCDATDSAAVKRIYRLKQRVDSKAMLVLVDSLDRARSIADVTDVAAGLLDSADGRPTTVVLPGARNVAPELVADDGSIGVRITHEAFSAELCRLSGVPLVSTSANISGRPSAKFFADIASGIIAEVDYVCRERRDDRTETEPSRIVKVENDGTVKILRP